MYVWSLLVLVGCLEPAAAQVPGRCEAPAASSQGAPGCYLDSAVEVGKLPPQVFWHIDRFPTIGAAQAATTPASHAAIIFGAPYLQTINSQRDWRPLGGKHIATVGPLPISSRGSAQTARFMEANTTPAMKTTAHVHSGPEAWYVVEGGQCLETPDGADKVTQGASSWIKAGPPMQLSNGAAATRKALVLVLHPTAEPWMTMDHQWQPKGLCSPTK
jgi:mannose-6-phosphate isomerase-like protein (cupin superfamily)